MKDPPGQCSSRTPNCTTMSPSATTIELIQRPPCVSRRALRRNSRVPSRPWGAACRERVVDHVRGAQRVEQRKVATAVAELVELCHDGFVANDIHDASVP